MKIAIATFFNAANYGAMLQAYALWQYLAQKGHDVQFVLYSPTQQPKLTLASCFVARSLQGLRIKLRTYVRQSMSAFADPFPRTRLFDSYGDLEQNPPEADVFIVGSDQMWNPAWVLPHLPYVFLDFAPPSSKRIAYAASFATSQWGADKRDEVATLLSQFDAISVREQSGVGIVKELADREASLVVDPTLLWDAAFFTSLCKNARPPRREPFVFSYFLDEWSGTAEERMCLDACLDQLGISKVVTDKTPVAGWLSPLYNMLGVTAKVSVEEWLISLKSASFVVTNSFHGTIFSILFQRPFLAVLLTSRMSAMNERIVSLLNDLELQDRMIYPGDNEKIAKVVTQPIQWEKVSDRVKELRTVAISFFDQAGIS